MLPNTEKYGKQFLHKVFYQNKWSVDVVSDFVYSDAIERTFVGLLPLI